MGAWLKGVLEVVPEGPQQCFPPPRLSRRRVVLLASPTQSGLAFPNRDEARMRLSVNTCSPACATVILKAKAEEFETFMT